MFTFFSQLNRSGPSQIIPGAVWLGSKENVENFPALYRLGVRAVVNVANELLPTQGQIHQSSKAGINKYLFLPLEEGCGSSVSNSREAITTAVALTSMLLIAKVPFMIHCAEGKSRSPSILAHAFSFVQPEGKAKTFEEHLSSFKQKRDLVSPSRSLMRDEDDAISHSRGDLFELVTYFKKLNMDSNEIAKQVLEIILAGHTTPYLDQIVYPHKSENGVFVPNEVTFSIQKDVMPLLRKMMRVIELLDVK